MVIVNNQMAAHDSVVECQGRGSNSYVLATHIPRLPFSAISDFHAILLRESDIAYPNMAKVKDKLSSTFFSMLMKT